MAAKCTEARRERYLAAVEAEASQEQPSPGFANEKKVDHLTITLELYTKAYELFKKYAPAKTQNQSQSRLTLWIAYRIGQTYYESGKFDMAVRFFERIAKSYRRERWSPLLRPLLATWYACAQQMGDVELSIRLLVEMLGYGVQPSDDPHSLEEDLLAVLRSSVPSSPNPEPMVIDLPESQPIFLSTVVFWRSEVKVKEPAAFQLCLTAPTDTHISSLPITSIEIYLSGSSVVSVQPSADAEAVGRIRRIDLGSVTSRATSDSVTGNLRWEPGSTVVFTGRLSSAQPALFKLSKIVLTLSEGPWVIRVPFDANGLRGSQTPAPRWLSSLDPPRFIPVNREDCSSVSVHHRTHNIVLSLSHKAPAYLDEDYPILLEVNNADDRELEVTLDILLQPTEIEGAENWIQLDEERSSSLVKGINLGALKPGVSVVKTLHLISTGGAGDRVLDISIQSAAVVDEPPENPELQDLTELLQTVVVPTNEAIKAEFGVVYKRARGPGTGVADLRTYGHDYWDDADGGEATVTTRMSCSGPWGVEVVNMVLVRQDNDHAKVLDSSLDLENDIPSEYWPGDEFCDACRVSMNLDDDLDLEEQAIVGPGKYEVTWRRILDNQTRGPLTTSTFPLPPLRPPVDGVIALLNVPATAKLHVPIPLTVTIRNRQPSRSANVTIQLEPDVADAFVVAGLRSGRIPILLPGAEETVTWRIIPVECGHVQVPRLKIMDKRRAIPTGQRDPNATSTEGSETEGDVVKIVDVRFDRLRERAAKGAPSVETSAADDQRIGTVLVLP
nr:glutathione transferase omega-1 [Mycena chlorophos]